MGKNHYSRKGKRRRKTPYFAGGGRPTSQLDLLDDNTIGFWVMASLAGGGMTRDTDVQKLAIERHGSIYYCVGDEKKLRATPNEEP